MRKILLNISLIIILTQPVISQVSNGWYWVNPYPSGMGIDEPHFTNFDTGFARINSKFFKTYNGGQNWILKSDTIYWTYNFSFINQNTGWLTSYNQRLFKTTNNGENWILVRDYILPNVSLLNFMDQNTGIITATGYNPPFPPSYYIGRTTNGGYNWNISNYDNIKSFQDSDLNDNLVLIVVQDQSSSPSIYKSTNRGNNWDTISTNIALPLPYKIEIINDSNYIIATRNHLVLTTNSGSSWSIVLTDAQNYSFQDINFWDSSNGITCGENGKIYRTIDGGENWINVTLSTLYHNLNAISIQANGNAIVTGEYGAVLKSSNYGINWETDARYVSIQDLYRVENIQNEKFYISGDSGTILVSTDRGDSWSDISLNTSNRIHGIDFINAQTGFLAGDNGMLKKTVNGGSTWDSINSYVNHYLIDVKFVNDMTGFVSGRYGYILKTTDGGNSWDSSRVKPGVFGPNVLELYFLNENTGFAGCTGWEIYKTTNQGQNWSLKTNFGASSPITSFHFFNEKAGIATAAGGYVLRTSDSGENWTLGERLTVTDLNDIKFVNQNTGFIVSEGSTYDGGPFIFKSTNAGMNWELQDFKLFSGPILSNLTFLDDSTLIAIGSNGTIIKTYSGGETVNIKQLVTEIPSGFSLSQNYPNPFNPVTKIKFAIPRSSPVKVVIYDILGRKVTSLINQKLSSGTYETQWDGSGYASGVYFYSLEAEGFKETRKMLLIK